MNGGARRGPSGIGRAGRACAPHSIIIAAPTRREHGEAPSLAAGDARHGKAAGGGTIERHARCPLARRQRPAAELERRLMLARALVVGVKLLVGAYPRWLGCTPSSAQRIYFANHGSHLDTVALWAALPPQLRRRTRPVAARDYWGGGGLRSAIAHRGLNVVLIERQRGQGGGNPLQPLYDALAAGDSLILFPEGTRNDEALPKPFKAGLYHLAQRFPQVELIPVYLDTARRSLPKGSLLPVPLICSVRFGAPMALRPGEQRPAFLERARAAVVELA
jgi:1-acyl-sn-glycerol-3-phosphate acyltransferase